MRIALDAAEAFLHSTAQDWTDGVPHLDWPIRLIGARHFAINQAYAVVDRALQFASLFTEAGLHISQVVPTASPNSILEVRLLLTRVAVGTG